MHPSLVLPHCPLPQISYTATHPTLSLFRLASRHIFDLSYIRRFGPVPGGVQRAALPPCHRIPPRSLEKSPVLYPTPETPPTFLLIFRV